MARPPELVKLPYGTIVTHKDLHRRSTYILQPPLNHMPSDHYCRITTLNGIHVTHLFISSFNQSWEQVKDEEPED